MDRQKYRNENNKNERTSPPKIHGFIDFPHKSRWIKRLLDIVISVLIIIFVLSWLLPFLCLLVYIIDGYPVFFIQQRVGLENTCFKCIKLRTISKIEHVESVSFLGRFLRYSKLDELPQFFNVLKGDMSIVGPRPHMLNDHQQFSAEIGPSYHIRHLVKPGITGLAQINGFDGPIKSVSELKGRIEYDLQYIQNWSFRLEVKIIGVTILYLLKEIWKTLNLDIHDSSTQRNY